MYFSSGGAKDFYNTLKLSKTVELIYESFISITVEKRCIAICHICVIKKKYDERPICNKEVKMANASNTLRKSDLRRFLKDNLVRISVTGGGIVVLFALLLIFFYLCYVVFPLFLRPELTLLKQFPTNKEASVAYVGLDEQNQFSYQISADGHIVVYRLANQELVFDERPDLPVSSVNFLPQNGLLGFGLTTGEVAFYRLNLSSFYLNNPSSSQPILKPLGKVKLTDTPIHQLRFSGDVQANILVVNSETDLVMARLNKFKVAERKHYPELLGATPIVSFDGRKVFVLSGDNLSRYRVSSDDFIFKEFFDVKKITGQPVSSVSTLLGGESLLMRLADGTTTQWFDVIDGDKRRLTWIKTFETDKGHLVPAIGHDMFANLTANEISIWHTKSGEQAFFEHQSTQSIPVFSFSPDAERLIFAADGFQYLFEFDSAYFGVSIDSLWKKIWYEGYDKPEYVWQSANTLQPSEGKLSVTPLLFGTLKVAVFALFFAIPLSIGAAIYTAYFMPASVRKVVKPSIEIMEALPTVILGFIAAIWLAPIIEQNIASVISLILLLPISFLLVAFVWMKLPSHWQKKVPKKGHLLTLVPLILLLTYFCIQAGPLIETYLLGGDGRSFVTQVLGLDFNQRNALVIGMAMGFAVIPTIFTIAEDAIYSVPKHLTNGSLALGATHWQTLMNVVLLTASPGIFSALMMGLGRAVGETMIVLMATGNTPLMEWNPFEGLRTLSANIAIEMPESEVGSSHYRVLFLTAFMLFIFTFSFNTIAEYVRQQLREKYRAL